MPLEKHILTEFDQALSQLKTDTILIATLAQKNVENAFSGLTQRNVSQCNQVIADDDDVDKLEIQIDNNSIHLMSKYQPFASDLRLVIVSMKVTQTLERISDHAVSIAKRARKVIKSGENDEVSFLEPAYKQALLMLKSSIHSYSEGSTTKALEVIAMNDDLKKFHKAATKAYTNKLEGPTNHHKFYLHLVFIARWLERIGNLSTNIAEDVIFMESAKNTHQTSGSEVL